MKKTAVHLTCAFELLLCSIAVSNAQPYAFTTIAGQGVRGGNDGTNRAAQFGMPYGIAVDKRGDIFVADTNAHAIRKIVLVGTDWVVTTIAGKPFTHGYADGTNGDARFYSPAGIALDDAGSLYVADTNNREIRKLVPIGTNWVVTTLAGSAQAGWADGTNDGARFRGPIGLARDSSGNLYVADHHMIRRVAPVGNDWVVTTLAGVYSLNGDYSDGTNSNARFNYPMGVAVDAFGNLYVADWGNSAIRKVTPVGTNYVVTTLARLGALGNPAGLALGQCGDLFVANTGFQTVCALTQRGTNWVLTTLAGLSGFSGTNDGVGTDVRFRFPHGIAVDKIGNLYVTDSFNYTVRLGWPTIPTLQIACSGNAAVLSWPLSATNFLLETSATPDFSGSWSLLTKDVATTEDSYVVTNLLNTTPTFFRLHKQ